MPPGLRANLGIGGVVPPVNEPHVDVAVIGAGIAGLATARHLDHVGLWNLENTDEIVLDTTFGLLFPLLGSLEAAAEIKRSDHAPSPSPKANFQVPIRPS